MRPAAAAIPLGGIAVLTPDGVGRRIGDLVDRPTVLVIPRYYGCLPCRDYLSRLSDRMDDVTRLGGQALGISVGADFQARWLIEKQGIRFPLLVDADRNLYDALELSTKWWVTLNPIGWWNYARAMGRGSRQGRIVEPNQLPGLALLDLRARAVWVHRGRALGDYPDLDQVLTRLADHTAAGLTRLP